MKNRANNSSMGVVMMSHCYISSMPTTIWKLPLRHIRMTRNGRRNTRWNLMERERERVNWEWANGGTQDKDRRFRMTNGEYSYQYVGYCLVMHVAYKCLVLMAQKFV